MKKYKAFLTMEFEADVETENEDEAREMLASWITRCGCHSWGRIQNAKVKRYWGGGKEVKMNKSKEVLFGVIDNYIEEMEIYSEGLQNKAYSERINKLLLSAMKETVYKLKLACKDLKKEMQK